MFHKEFKTIDEQLLLLKSKNLIINDCENAKHILSTPIIIA